MRDSEAPDAWRSAPSLVAAARRWRTEALLARREHFARLRDEADAALVAIDHELIWLGEQGTSR